MPSLHNKKRCNAKRYDGLTWGEYSLLGFVPDGFHQPVHEVDVVDRNLHVQRGETTIKIMVRRKQSAREKQKR